MKVPLWQQQFLISLTDIEPNGNIQQFFARAGAVRLFYGTTSLFPNVFSLNDKLWKSMDDNTYPTPKPRLGPATNQRYFSKIIYCIPREIKMIRKENNCKLCNPRILADLTQQRKCSLFPFISPSYTFSLASIFLRIFFSNFFQNSASNLKQSNTSSMLESLEQDNKKLTTRSITMTDTEKLYQENHCTSESNLPLPSPEDISMSYSHKFCYRTEILRF